MTTLELPSAPSHGLGVALRRRRIRRPVANMPPRRRARERLSRVRKLGDTCKSTRSDAQLPEPRLRLDPRDASHPLKLTEVRSRCRGPERLRRQTCPQRRPAPSRLANGPRPGRPARHRERGQISRAIAILGDGRVFDRRLRCASCNDRRWNGHAGNLVCQEFGVANRNERPDPAITDST